MQIRTSFSLHQCLRFWIAADHHYGSSYWYNSSLLPEFVAMMHCASLLFAVQACPACSSLVSSLLSQWRMRASNEFQNVRFDYFVPPWLPGTWKKKTVEVIPDQLWTQTAASWGHEWVQMQYRNNIKPERGTLCNKKEHSFMEIPITSDSTSQWTYIV